MMTVQLFSFSCQKVLTLKNKMRTCKVFMLLEDNVEDQLYFSNALAEIDISNCNIEDKKSKQMFILLNHANQLSGLSFIAKNILLRSELECLDKFKSHEWKKICW